MLAERINRFKMEHSEFAEARYIKQVIFGGFGFERPDLNFMFLHIPLHSQGSGAVEAS